jgi:hypothetical protein
MPKLPANYVKAPGFDNPLRSTSGVKASADRSLVLNLDEEIWKALHAASAAERVSAESLVLSALERHLALIEQSAIAPSPEPPPSKRAQLLDQLYGQFVRRSWLQCVMTMRAIVRESRA